MPYYKNIGTCEMKYHGVSIQPNEVKFFEKPVMDNNLMQVPEEESTSRESTVKRRKSSNHKTVEPVKEEATSKAVSSRTEEPESETSSESNCE